MTKTTAIARLLVLGAAVWACGIVLAAPAIGSRSAAARACALALYTAGSFVCHQIPERSFHVAGRQLAVCGRCTGLYVSAVAGGIAALLSWRRPAIGDRMLLAIAAAPTALSWGLEHAGIAAQSNAVRAIAALPLGFAAAWVVIGLLIEERKRSAQLPSV